MAPKGAIIRDLRCRAAAFQPEEWFVLSTFGADMQIRVLENSLFS